jgi:hypothetical protein
MVQGKTIHEEEEEEGGAAECMRGVGGYAMEGPDVDSSL